MKLLISGAGGQLGLALARRLRDEHDVVALGRDAFDLSDASAYRQTLAREKPDVLLNCAAYTAVDRAESEPGMAHVINADGPAHLAHACRDFGMFLIHFSTDYVFDGRASRPYAETDATEPMSVYGSSKLAGEKHIAEVSAAHLILRLSWVYGNDGTNFYKTMLRLAQDRPLLRVVADQSGVPNFTGDLADAVACVLRRPLTELRAARGLYHLSSQGQTTWFDFARAIMAGANLQGPVAVEPISTSEYPTAAQRPPYSVLDGSRFAATFGWIAPHWSEGLQRCLHERVRSA
jgi:dTDP-4-dehydrorhamnose reductase